jgi:hypothetical protein
VAFGDDGAARSTSTTAVGEAAAAMTISAALSDKTAGAAVGLTDILFGIDS